MPGEEALQLLLPLPDNFETIVWFGIGITFARAFGKRLDQDIQATQWFKDLKGWQKWLVKRLLDALHHWQIGALLILYAPVPQIVWLGAGILVDDIPDLPRRIRGYFKVG